MPAGASVQIADFQPLRTPLPLQVTPNHGVKMGKARGCFAAFSPAYANLMITTYQISDTTKR